MAAYHTPSSRATSDAFHVQMCMNVIDQTIIAAERTLIEQTNVILLQDAAETADRDFYDAALLEVSGFVQPRIQQRLCTLRRLWRENAMRLLANAEAAGALEAVSTDANAAITATALTRTVGNNGANRERVRQRRQSHLATVQQLFLTSDKKSGNGSRSKDDEDNEALAEQLLGGRNATETSPFSISAPIVPASGYFQHAVAVNPVVRAVGARMLQCAAAGAAATATLNVDEATAAKTQKKDKGDKKEKKGKSGKKKDGDGPSSLELPPANEKAMAAAATAMQNAQRALDRLFEARKRDVGKVPTVKADPPTMAEVTSQQMDALYADGSSYPAPGAALPAKMNGGTDIKLSLADDDDDDDDVEERNTNDSGDDDNDHGKGSKHAGKRSSSKKKKKAPQEDLLEAHLDPMDIVDFLAADFEQRVARRRARLERKIQQQRQQRGSAETIEKLEQRLKQVPERPVRICVVNAVADRFRARMAHGQSGSTNKLSLMSTPRAGAVVTLRTSEEADGIPEFVSDVMCIHGNLSDFRN